MENNAIDVETVRLDDENSTLIIIDQTLLPYRMEQCHLKTQKEIWNAIFSLQVRGAPAIGVAAAMGIYLAAKSIESDNTDEFMKKLEGAASYLESARPTAVNLSWALNRMLEVARNALNEGIPAVKRMLYNEAQKIKEEDIWVCKTIGENGLSLLKPGMGLLTHCNAGQLATAKYGTATAPMYLGHEKGYNFRIFCDETRPLLQGARLTAYELHSAGMDTTLICDNMAFDVMKKGWVDAVLVGCDRVARNGDVANKIGTSYVALAAKHYNIPFYVCAPTSTIDINCKDGSDIVVEQRPGEEVTEMWYEQRMTAKGVKIYNPAFDVTEASFITAIITEYGIAYPPYEKSIEEIFKRKQGNCKNS